jgi:hypothetical protein
VAAAATAEVKGAEKLRQRALELREGAVAAAAAVCLASATNEETLSQQENAVAFRLAVKEAEDGNGNHQAAKPCAPANAAACGS